MTLGAHTYLRLPSFEIYDGALPWLTPPLAHRLPEPHRYDRGTSSQR